MRWAIPYGLSVEDRPGLPGSQTPVVCHSDFVLFHQPSLPSSVIAYDSARQMALLTVYETVRRRRARCWNRCLFSPDMPGYW